MADPATPSKPLMRVLQPGETPQVLSQQAYNESAQHYLDWASTQSSHHLIWLDKLLKTVQNDRPLTNARALDLGCGAGIPATLPMAQTVEHVTGTDISSGQLELAVKHFLDAGVPPNKYKFIQSDMTSLDFEPASFHAVTAFYSIIHLSLADQRIVISRIYEWLKPGGVLLVNVAARPSADEGEVAENWLGKMTAFWASFGTRGTVNLLKENKLDVLECETIKDQDDAEFAWIIARKSQQGRPKT